MDIIDIAQHQEELILAQHLAVRKPNINNNVYIDKFTGEKLCKTCWETLDLCDCLKQKK